MIKNYLQLFKFRYHIFFVSVLLGALFFATEINFKTFNTLLLCYVSFNLLLYTGLYIINDIADRKSDSTHEIKKKRPIASGAISVRSAFIFALLFIIFGLFLAIIIFNQKIFIIYLIFVLINLFYTFIAKKIPYLEIFSNALTHPLRFVLGASLVGFSISLSFFAALFFLASGIAIMRRVVEMNHKDYKARKVLSYYTKERLKLLTLILFAFILVLFFYDYKFNIILYSLVIIIYFFFVFGVNYIRAVNKFFVKMSLK